MAAGVAEINHDYRNDLFHKWFENYSGSSVKKLRRLIKKKVTVSDWKRYVEERCLSYHIRGCCNTICRKSDDHQVISDKEARLLLDFCQAVEKKPDVDDPIRKEALPVPESIYVLNTNALRYHYLSPKAPAPAPAPASVLGLNSNALCYYYTAPKTPANDDPIRKKETSPAPESDSGLNTNAIHYHCTRPKTPPANDDPIQEEVSPTSVAGLNTYHHNGPLFPTLPSSSDAVGAEGSHPRYSVITSICTTILPNVPKLSRTEHYKQINQDSHQPWSKNSHLLPW